MKTLKFDVMSDGRFVGTFFMPITSDLIEEYEGNEPVWDYVKLNDRAKAFVEAKRPILKGKNYKFHAYAI